MNNIYDPENAYKSDMLPLADLKSRVGEIVYCLPMNDWAKVTPYGLLYFGVTDPSRWEDIEITYGDKWVAYGIADIVWEKPEFKEIMEYPYVWRNMCDETTDSEENI